ncbi:MAG: hypothetical protein A3E26_01205 [Chlamydiae bacterium RIFCSPHIGHO2_12_FULL_49_32]|nr:MAG: hypothetical protein A3D18_02290 [Chlamydiae bacterium RIFCSPHIGHO2_02_FULL_49_29]OGN63371.1 MAG: hypothetical protein A3E26_01205 [Chlamydiae bacterium RIFCSPHIGHO2_12_FULL_49_32]
MFWLYLLVRLRLFREERRVKRLFYKDPHFRFVDHAFFSAWRFCNPYTLSKRFLKARGEKEIHLYGETYLTTYDELGRACGMSAQDRVLELGCGRGRGALFWSCRFGAAVHGVDWIEEFILRAQALVKRCALTSPCFFCEDYLTTDLSGYTIVYLYGTCLEKKKIERLIERFLSLPPSVQIITISYPLSEYHSAFRVQKELSVAFPWGRATAYLQQVRKR